MRRYILALVLTLGLAACEYQVTGYPQQPAMTAAPLVTDTSLHIHWHSSVDEIAKVCPAKDGEILYGCATWNLYGTMSVCDVQALMPKDFNDVVRLIILGHEVFHCLGAQHA